MKPSYLISGLLALLIIQPAAADDKQPAAKPISFEKDIKPIFENKCVHCHNRKTLPDRVSFENAKLAFLPDKFGKVYFVPGKPEQSLLIKALEQPDFHEMMMPMVGPRTSPEQTAVFRQWISEGARWPKGKAGKVKVEFRALE